MNGSIAIFFRIVNSISKVERNVEKRGIDVKEAILIVLRLIEPMVPHLAEECLSLIGKGSSIANEPWPKVDAKYLENKEVTIVIQINGKRRGEVVVSKDASEIEVKKEMQNIKNINDALSEKIILKSIYVPNKILNIVVKA